MTFEMGDFIFVEEAAKRLGYTSANISRLIRTGKLKATKRGRRYIILPEAIDEFIMDQASEGFFK